MFVLDTNVISELRRPEKAGARVSAWASSQPLTGFFISSITVLEIELGARLVERRDKAQGAVLRAWIDQQVMPRFESRVLQVDTAVAQVCAGLRRSAQVCAGLRRLASARSTAGSRCAHRRNRLGAWHGGRYPQRLRLRAHGRPRARSLGV